MKFSLLWFTYEHKLNFIRHCITYKTRYRAKLTQQIETYHNV